MRRVHVLVLLTAVSPLIVNLPPQASAQSIWSPRESNGAAMLEFLRASEDNVDADALTVAVTGMIPSDVVEEMDENVYVRIEGTPRSGPVFGEGPASGTLIPTRLTSVSLARAPPIFEPWTSQLRRRIVEPTVGLVSFSAT